MFLTTKLSIVGDVPAEIDLLEKFDVVLAAFEKIEPQYKPIIIDIANKMGNGMADYLKKKVHTCFTPLFVLLNDVLT